MGKEEQHISNEIAQDGAKTLGSEPVVSPHSKCGKDLSPPVQWGNSHVGASVDVSLHVGIHILFQQRYVRKREEPLAIAGFDQAIDDVVTGLLGETLAPVDGDQILFASFLLRKNGVRHMCS